MPTFLNFEVSQPGDAARCKVLALATRPSPRRHKQHGVVLCNTCDLLEGLLQLARPIDLTCDCSTG
jgi:hypothetical protein